MQWSATTGHFIWPVYELSFALCVGYGLFFTCPCGFSCWTIMLDEQDLSEMPFIGDEVSSFWAHNPEKLDDISIFITLVFQSTLLSRRIQLQYFWTSMAKMGDVENHETKIQRIPSLVAVSFARNLFQHFRFKVKTVVVGSRNPSWSNNMYVRTCNASMKKPTGCLLPPRPRQIAAEKHSPEAGTSPDFPAGMSENAYITQKSMLFVYQFKSTVLLQKRLPFAFAETLIFRIFAVSLTNDLIGGSVEIYSFTWNVLHLDF